MKVRKLHDKDWSSLKKWGLDESLGNQGFIVCSTPDNMPIAAVWINIEDETAIPAECGINPDYRDTDRSDALQLLTDFTIEIVETMEYKMDNLKMKELWLGEQS